MDNYPSLQPNYKYNEYEINGCILPQLEIINIYKLTQVFGLVATFLTNIYIYIYIPIPHSSPGNLHLPHVLWNAL